jgi:predicted ATPase/DNA-binding SARP family transcriptional activator
MSPIKHTANTREKSAHVNQIPAPLTSFIGREKEKGEVRHLLETRRLLTLVGVGGSGKTRLAAHIGRDIQDQSVLEVFWVELSPLTDPALVPQAIANAAGLRKNSPLSLIEALVGYFAERKALLLIDNCEHLLAASTDIIQKLLAGAPALQVLATSRERLHIPGEAVYLVASLSTPSPDWQSPPSTENLLEFEAIRLFSERAQSVENGFQLTDRNALAVAQVCYQLDGIPLAIELAAARVKILSVEQIAARLHDRFNLLSAGPGALLPRHQTLRAAIDWSYDLSSPKEQVVFRRCSVFAGGFTIEAAESICSGETASIEVIRRAEVLDLLARLVDKSLIQADTLHGKEARFVILETLRQYGQEKLVQAGEEPALRKRHQQWYLALAEGITPDTRDQQETAWLGYLEKEHNNLRSALEWSLAQKNENAAALRMGAALHYFWHLHGYWREGRDYLKRALACADNASDLVPLAKVLNGAGLLAWDQGDYPQAYPCFEKSLAIWRKLDDRINMTRSLNYLGAVTWLSGEFTAAQSWLDESIQISRGHAHAEELALALGLSGVVERDQTHYARAIGLLQESIALCRQGGLKSILADSLDTLGGVLSLQGEFDRANQVLSESWELAQELGNQWGASFSTYKLAVVALKQKRFVQAAGFFEQSLAWRTQNGDQRGVVQCLEGLAWLAVEGSPTAPGLPEAAARLFGAADALRTAIHSPLPPSDQIDHASECDAARQLLGAMDFSAAWDLGRGLGPEKIAGLAQNVIAQIKAAAVFPLPRPGRGAELIVISLGAAQVYVGGRALARADWVYARAEELFYYFLCFPARTKEQVGLDLWPEASETQLRSSFHRTLYHLRRALGRSDLIVIANAAYQFNRSVNVWFDAREFETSLVKAEKLERLGDAEAVSYYQAALNLYQGAFLPDMDNAWVLIQRQTYRKKFEQAAFALGRLYFSADKFSAAQEIYRRLLEGDIFLEAAHRELMRCLARQGERAQALQQYNLLVNVMRAELDSQPAPELRALYERLRRGESI